MTSTDQRAETNMYMPSLGEGVDEATITRWLKQPGEHVDEDEPLLEVATDKVDTEIPAPCAGVLDRILAEEDDVVAVGDPLAVIRTAVAHPESVAPPEPVQSAELIQVDAARVQSETRDELAHSTSPATSDTPSAQPQPEPRAAGSRAEKLPSIRRTIARRMMESLRTSAQLTTVLEADVTSIARLRAAHKSDFLERTGAKLSFLPFFVKAAIAALPEYPMLNASLNSEVTEVTFHDAIHLGIAVDGPKGLMVPVIRNAQSATIARLATSIAEVADKVRSSSITVDELSGGTFTITNTGSRGALFDTPIINHPQTGILGVGAVVERVVPVRDHDDSLRIEVRAMAYLSLTYDHRIVDGADAACFLTSMKERLEAGFGAADLTL